MFTIRYLWAKYEGFQFFHHVPHFTIFTRSVHIVALERLVLDMLSLNKAYEDCLNKEIFLSDLC